MIITNVRFLKRRWKEALSVGEKIIQNPIKTKTSDKISGRISLGLLV
jgi:hypothetical protein